MGRIFHIAVREFVSTAMTKGFLFGGIVLPIVLMVLMAVAMPLLLNEKVPEVTGSIALADGTGVLAGDIAAGLTPEAVAAWQEARAGEMVARMADPATGPKDMAGAVDAAGGLAGAGTINAHLSVDVLAGPFDGAAIEAAKAPLMDGTGMTDGGRMALVVIDADAVESAGPGGGFGGFQVFVRPKLDDRVADLVRDRVRETIRETRIRTAGFEPADLEALTDVAQRPTREVSAAGEHAALGELGSLIGFAFMFLLMMSVFISGQYLLTTTIEEKSSRVIELLLSSASPMSLMAGKVFGQMCVGLFLIGVYGSLGWGGLLVAERLNLVSPVMILWFFCYFFIAYTTIASLMAAIGSAVNELREAQSLMAPVMMLMMIPYMLWLPIGRDPSSLFATIMSFVPGVSPFVMIIRLGSTQPPPLWQVLATIAVGVATAYACLWAAAKVFRVGLLQFGKAPNYATMLRWIRMA